MNERIKELLIEAGIYECDDFEPHPTFEKFAELIVRECVSMVNGFERGIRYQGAIQNPADAIARLSVAMREHFGVEE